MAEESYLLPAHPASHCAPRAEADLVVLMPVFNDWAAAEALLRDFARLRGVLPSRVHFLLVNDGSLQAPPPQLCRAIGDECTSLEVLCLMRNMGHQRAIAIGLCYLWEHWSCRGVVIMDSDGEDPPSAVPALLACASLHGDEPVVFASRLKRSEGTVFTVFYHFYRLVHLILTGLYVRVGNFSYVPQGHIRRLVVSSELWNHYAATVVQSRVPFVTIPVARAKRLDGQSKMNFPSLVSHGLSAMSVFSATVGARVLVGLFLLLLLASVIFLAVLGIRVFSSLAVPGWATYSAGLLLVLITQLLSVSVVFTFVVLGGRSAVQIIPLRDYKLFVDGGAPNTIR